MSWWTWAGLRGAVLEQVPGRLVDISAGGCSVETTSSLGTGTFGVVEVEGLDASLAEVARVCNVTERPGAAAPFLVRLEFVPFALPLQHAAGDRAAHAAAPLAAAGEKAGSNLTLVRRDGVAVNGGNEQTTENTRENAGEVEMSGAEGDLANDLN